MINDVIYKIQLCVPFIQCPESRWKSDCLYCRPLMFRIYFYFHNNQETGACVESVMFVNHVQWNIFNYLELLPPATSLRESNAFSCVCLQLCSGGRGGPHVAITHDALATITHHALATITHHALDLTVQVPTPPGYETHLAPSLSAASDIL